MDEVSPTFFSKLGEAMKLVEHQYKQLLMVVDSDNKSGHLDHRDIPRHFSEVRGILKVLDKRMARNRDIRR